MQSNFSVPYQKLALNYPNKNFYCIKHSVFDKLMGNSAFHALKGPWVRCAEANAKGNLGKADSPRR